MNTVVERPSASVSVRQRRPAVFTTFFILYNFGNMSVPSLMRNVKDVFFQNNAGPKNMIGGMVTFHKASTFGLHLPKKARKHEHFGSRGAPHLSPLPPNVTLSGYLFTIFQITMVSEFTSLFGKTSSACIVIFGSD